MRESSLRLAWLGLNPERVDRLIGDLGAPGAVVDAVSRGEVDVPAPLREVVRRRPGDLEARLGAMGARFVTREEPGFPPWLEMLPDSPRWLFVKGTLPDAPGVAVVGSRRATRYGLDLAEAIGRTVAGAGWPVISGLAAGIDGAAHRGSLAAGHGGAAVLGSGIDVWYPARHRTLGEQVLARGGAVLSEFGPGIAPEAWRFPARNRIIAGLAGAVIVVEAAERSGALITARLAVEQGREVIAVPGDIDRLTSVGCNLLIRDGAHPLARLDEMVEMLERILGPAPNLAAAPPVEEVLGGVLGPVPVAIDDVALALSVPVAGLLPELSRLEIAGRVVIEEGTVRTV